MPVHARDRISTVLRTFSHEKLKPYIAKLVPEIPLYGAKSDPILVSARADAIAFEGDAPVAVFDWKSDVAPTPDDDKAYASQLLNYLEWFLAVRCGYRALSRQLEVELAG